MDARKFLGAEREAAFILRPDPMTEMGKMRREAQHLILVVNGADRGESIGDIGEDAIESDDGAACVVFRLPLADDRAGTVRPLNAVVDLERFAARDGAVENFLRVLTILRMT